MRVVLVSPIIALTYVNLFVEIAALENDSPDRLQSEPVRSRFSYRYGDLQKNLLAGSHAFTFGTAAAEG
jgi:hypothetical protein